jgi:probable rRNA maturation factor
MRAAVTIEVVNRQRAVRLDVRWLRRLAAVALEKCMGKSGDGRDSLCALTEIGVAIVSDRTIAQVHRDFMGIAGPTDVITFEHGEIVMSAETAAANAAAYGHRIEVELALYTIHGLLHLNGYDDTMPAAATRMRRVQSRILQSCLAQCPPP